MPKLVVLSGADVKEVAIKSELTIGRSSTNDLPLNEENASRQHAKVLYKDKKAKLVDLDSSNGTRVNGMKVKEKDLAHGDTITIGKSQVIYQEDGELNREGSVIGGYKLTQKLGEGGMGTVFRATQLSMDRSVALKILKKELCDSREFVKGFLREARLAGQLNHAGIIQVHEVNQHKEVIYFSMEYVEGKTAQELIEKEGKLRLHQALDIVIAMADALAYADQKGIIHRDIKPANIIVTKNNEYKLADLGLAGGNSAQNKDKKSARVMGTPNYIAPEQSENKELDIRADIYALGGTFYHLLTGKPPFTGANAIAIITMHHTEPRPKVRKEVPGIPKSVEDLIERMMAIDKKDRPANAKDLLEALRDIKQKEASAIRKSLPQSAKQDPINTARTTIKEKVDEEGEDGEGRKGNISRRMAKDGQITRGKTMTAVHKPAGDGLNAVLGLLNVLAVLALLTAVGLYFYGPEKVFPKNFDAEEQAAIDAHARKKRQAEEWNAEQRKAREDYIQRMRASAGNNDTPPGPNPPAGTGTNSGNNPKNSGTNNGGTATNPPPPVDPKEKTPAEILIATNEVCAKAQTKMDKNDWVSTRRMLTDHLQIYGQTEQTRLAQEKLADVNTRINLLLDTCLKNVLEKSDANDYAAAAFWGSKAIALDPTSKASLEIQNRLGRNDFVMQSQCDKAYRDGQDKINNGDFQGAAKDLGNILNKANGTIWTAKLRSLHLEALYGDRISKKLNKVLVDAFKNEAPFVMVARGTDIGYTVSKLTGFKVSCTDGPVMKISNFNDDTMHNWIAKIPNLDAIDHLALGIFLDLAGVSTVAAEEIQKAARDRVTAADAIAYQTTHNMIKNFRYYDFIDWKQQLDWQVQAGTWAFQDERFECTTEDIGEIGLDPAKAELAAANLSLSFVVYPKGDKSGFQVDLFQDDKHRLGVVCDDGKARLEGVAGGEVAQAEAPVVLTKDKPAEFLIEVRGDNVTLTPPSPAKPVKLTVKGAADLKGKLRIQILSGTSAFDDILIQN